VMEKHLALEVSRRVREKLETVGYEVSMTRDRDVHVRLQDRVAFANARRPDLFVSIHCNSMPTQAARQRTAGLQTFFLSADASGEEAGRTALRENADSSTARHPRTEDTLAFIVQDLQRTEAHRDSAQLASLLHAHVLEATSTEDRGVQQAPLFVLMGMDAPAALVELGFIAHPVEGKRLQEAAYQDKLAEGIVAGIRAFLHQRPSAAVPLP
jgi:N-acetylmuramoyl-L-alanine amidase